MAKIIITPAEKRYLEERLKKLSDIQEIARTDVKAALNYGSETWHDNDMYDTAKLKQQTVNQEQRELEFVLSHAQIITPPDDPKKVDVGTQVTLENLDTNTELTLKIGGDYIAKLSDEWISLLSPVGKAIQQKKVGDEVTVVLPAGNIIYKILAIHTLA